MSILIPAPCIIPLCLPKFGKSKSINTNTLIDICCDKEAENIELFYTIDGTKPQPYVDIVQGSKTIKFVTPFSLPPGKVTLKAITAHSLMTNMRSSVVTKTFHVEQSGDSSRKTKERKSHKKNSCIEDFKSEDKKTKDLVLNLPVKTVEDSHPTDCAKSCVASDAMELSTADILPVEPLMETVEPLEQVLDKSDLMESADIIEELNDSCCESIDDISEGSLTYFTKEDVQVEHNPVTADASDAPCTENNVLIKYGIPLQHCFVCSKVNSFTSRYCDKCGTKLYHVCSSCKECNPTFAVFCQYCGVKLSKDENDEEPEIS